ncbi:MFS transporter [Solirubrobacter sp. CPCC 204708]|uniref:MFS transporter n=1 Tax=Solirubrobacter deserti TaxID=2282478 RepID=A0ABT4RKK0_9ACTN|nr:MFS transporter [Solirubrobacter deserti]MBE2317351.1 MFS transporter [Solirubrobacter deserti]MDA0139080.1 MFS transporter [Solirubrobacter deserti]
MSFRRDRLTWVAYALLAWFAFLQAAPGLVVPYLRDELDIGYTTGGLHVAAFAAGSTLAGLSAPRLEAALGRRALLWGSVAVMMLGVAGLVAGPVVAVTIGSLLVAGYGGGLLLATDQALLADHHGEQRAIALTEANVCASAAYVLLVGAIALLDWRAALLASFLAPVALFAAARAVPITTAPAARADHGRLGAAFAVAATMMFCTVAAEWCLTAWGASFAEEAADVSADTAVALMFGYFGGVLAGRVTGSALARRHPPPRLLAAALVVAALGFAVLWPATNPAQVFAGLFVIGVGLGNLFPFALAVTVALAPDRAALASGRAVLAGSTAVLLAPLTIGALADATSITGALLVVPVMLALAALALYWVTLRL